MQRENLECSAVELVARWWPILLVELVARWWPILLVGSVLHSAAAAGLEELRSQLMPSFARCPSSRLPILYVAPVIACARDFLLLCHPAHHWRLQYVPPRALEQSKVELHRQVCVAHIERDALRARQPKWQRAHVLTRKSKAVREGPQ
eukprot:1390086-Prymnesium_polylepis.2